MDWERNHTPSSFEDLQLSISHCDVDQVWHFLSQKPARPQIDLVVQQFSISHRVHVWWRFVISKRTLQKKNEQKWYKENEPTETPNNTAGFAVNFIWLCLAALFWPRCVLFVKLCNTASSNHQTCWALSRPLRCWKPSFFCTGTLERSPWERRLKTPRDWPTKLPNCDRAAAVTEFRRLASHWLNAIWSDGHGPKPPQMLACWFTEKTSCCWKGNKKHIRRHMQHNYGQTRRNHKMSAKNRKPSRLSLSSQSC